MRKDNHQKYILYKHNRQKGYAVLELLFYISFFVVLSLVVIYAMVVMSGSFRETVVHSKLVRSANVMERISREIKQAYNVNSISTDTLVLGTTDSGGVNTTVGFALSGANVEFSEGGLLVGNLNTPDITVSALSFTQLTVAEGQAVKIALTVEYVDDPSGRSFDFYDTVVLRGSY